MDLLQVVLGGHAEVVQVQFFNPSRLDLKNRLPHQSISRSQLIGWLKRCSTARCFSQLLIKLALTIPQLGDIQTVALNVRFCDIFDDFENIVSPTDRYAKVLKVAAPESQTGLELFCGAVRSPGCYYTKVQTMNNVSVKIKLAIAFSLLTLMFLGISGLAIRALSNAEGNFESYVNGIGERANTAHLVREAVDARAIAARNLVLVTSPNDVALEKAVVLKAHADVGENLAKLNRSMGNPGVSPEARKMVDEITAIEKRYAPVALSIVDMALNN